MLVACLFMLLASPVVFLAIKGIFVIVMEGPLSDVRALTIEVPDSDSTSDSDIYVSIGTGLPAFYALFGPDFLDCEEVKPWDADLGNFMNDIEEDADGDSGLLLDDPNEDH